jgi:hypothetical protein
MKKVLTAIMFVLGFNFLAVVGGVGYLFQAGKLDRDKALAMKELVFPTPSTQPATTQPTEPDPTTQATARLDELLARRSGMTVGEQVDFLRQTFDAQAVQLDRRRRELDDLQRQIELAKQQVAADREKVDADRAKLTAEQTQATRLESDQGFQDALAMYLAMPPKQVKQIFMSLPDGTVERYLQAMGPSGSRKILKEFKTTEEVARIQSILEKMRQPEASMKD